MAHEPHLSPTARRRRPSPETFRASPELRAWLAAEARRRGVSKASIIIGALERERRNRSLRACRSAEEVSASA